MMQPDRVAAITACRERHRHRWLAASVNLFPYSENPREFEVWFAERYRYLTERLVEEINAADNIIGKQWHYDYACGTDATLDAHVREVLRNAAVEAVSVGP